MLQIAADALGVPLESLRIFHGSTTAVTEGFGSFHSRSTVMSGTAFVTLGASVWGWLGLWGVGFFALALLIAWSGTPAGMLLLGLGWFICLVGASIHLRSTR